MNRRTKYLIWLLALALVMACAPTLSSAPAVPALDPDAINKIIAQTADAASTRTAVAAPTSAPTETFTPTPRGTNTPEPTITETFIYVYNSPTAFVIPPIAKTFGPTSNKDYACEVLNSPTDGTIYDPRLVFKVRWRFKNVGRQEWYRESVDFIYDYGDRFHRTSGYDLEKDTKIGEVAEFFVDMQAPKDPGTYTTHWALQIGVEMFCKVSLTIGVK
ncbi:MAG TPA: NBR1-Ig-like domain-containing protein [Anaerolineales bacterium]|nr:NBR1-Ig-like domain-containing protein [Anaerolineales bacterium]